MYLSEYGRKGWLAPTTRFINDIPAICAVDRYWRVHLHRLCAGSALFRLGGFPGAGADRIPVVVRTTENLNLVPASLREAAPALGAPRWKVVLVCCVRHCAGGLTGILLAIARVSGETAPLLFTALNTNSTSFDLNGPMPTCPW